MWVKVDDRFDEHPKFEKLGAAATALWFKCLAYCNRNLTDGFVPSSAAEQRAFALDPAAPMFPVNELLEAGLWERRPGGYYFHDYPDYQPSKAEVTAEREAAARRKERWRNARRNAVPNAVRSGTPGSRFPVVKAPSQSSIVSESLDPLIPADAVRAGRAHPRPSLEEVRAYCRERRNAVDPQAWYDHYTSNGWKVGRNAMKDWKAAVRTWERDRMRQTTIGAPRGQVQGPGNDGGAALAKAQQDRLKWEKENEQ
jgi:hypothetical protein